MTASPTIVPAEPTAESARAYAKLYDISTGETAMRMFGPGYLELLAVLFRDETTLHSYDRTHFATVGARVVAHITCFSSQEFPARRSATFRAIRQIADFTALRVRFFDIVRTLRRASLGPAGGNDLHVGSIAVLGQFQRCGIATALLEHALEQAYAEGHDQLSLDVGATNTAAIAAYRNNGFTIQENRGSILKLVRPIRTAGGSATVKR